MCGQYSALFIIVVTLSAIGIFTTTLLNMIFAIKVPNKDSFQFVSFTEYRERIKINFTTDITFGENLPENDYYGCVTSDYIYKWRNTTMKKKIKEFEIEMLQDIIEEDEECREGYTKCGSLNNDNNFLCLYLDENSTCPINKIIINDNETIEDSNYNYTSHKFGDKYIHYTNEAFENFLLKGFNVTWDYIKTSLDSLQYKRVIEENPGIFRYWGDGYLNADVYTTLNKDEVKVLVKENEKKAKIYTEDKIAEMNLNMTNYKSSIKKLGIFIFVLSAFLPLNLSLHFLSRNKDECSHNSYHNRNSPGQEIGDMCALCCCKYSCMLCFRDELYPKKVAYIIYLLYSPILIAILISLVFIFLQKSKCSDYLAMSYIDDFKKENYFDALVSNYNREFVVLLIALGFFLLYPIIMLFITKDKEYDEPSKNMELTNSGF